MARIDRNDVIGSQIFIRAAATRSSSASTDTVGHLRLWNLLSSTAFRRRLLDSIRCGGGWSRHSATDDACEERETVDAPLTYKPLSGFRKEKDRSRSGSSKLSDLLKLDLHSASLIADGGSAREDNAEQEEDEKADGGGEVVRRKMERFEVLKSAARLLQSEGVEERENGAKAVRRLAKDDSDARNTLAMLGAIPPLITMLDDDDGGLIRAQFRVEALYALLNLGIGNDSNKAAIVQAGAIHKMLKLIEPTNGRPDVALSEAIVANFLALSALDTNKLVIGSSGAIPFLVDKLKDLDEKSSPQVKEDCLRALYNLSILPSNVLLLLETDVIHFFMNSLGDMEISERIMSILSNVVAIPEGRKAVSSVPDALVILIDVLNWNDSPRCQEMATYVLMVMAHKAYGDRQAMIEAGIVSSLLELTLIGSTLAQKRASRILEFLMIDKGKQVSETCNHSMGTAVVSAPIRGSSSPLGNLGVGGESLEDEANMSEEKKAVKRLVQQSLQSNLRRIVKRANLPQDFVPSEHLMSLTASSTSKSLPL